MATNRFPSDPGLSARMVLTMFLLGLLGVAFVAVLLVLRVSTVLVVLIAGGLLFAQYFFSDKIALASMRAHEVTPQQAPELHALIDRLCAMADLPKPRVAISETDIPNAFATGRNQRHAVVCVTTGIMRRLTEPELEAVLAHELSHIAHRDVAVMTIASFLGILAGFVVRFGLYSGMGGGRRDDRDNGVPVVMLVILASVIVYALSFLLTRALSRYRELSADRGAAVVTGRPSLLASALVKISGEMSRIPTRDLRAAEPVNALLLVPAVARGFSISSLFSTHPPLEHRLDQLARMEAELGRPS
jgi:heat shock protein HtpX